MNGPKTLGTNHLCGNKRPTSGHCLILQSFFDIEYQTYGWVFASQEYKKKLNSIFSLAATAFRNICITIAYDADTKEILGINTFVFAANTNLLNRWLNR